MSVRSAFQCIIITFERFLVKNVKKPLDFPKKNENVVFFIRRMQKVGQKGWGTDFWPGPPVGGPIEGILTVRGREGGGGEVRRRR